VNASTLVESENRWTAACASAIWAHSNSRSVTRCAIRWNAWPVKVEAGKHAQKLRQISLRSWCTHPLHGHCQHHLADRGPMLRTMAGARSIDVSDEVELLSDPEQCTDIAHRPYPDGACLAQIGPRWRVRGAQDDLPGY